MILEVENITVVFSWPAQNYEIFCCIKNFSAVSFPYITTYKNTKITPTIQFLALQVIYDLSALKVTSIDTFILQSGVEMRFACALLEPVLFFCVNL